jgi:hypothetical protein
LLETLELEGNQLDEFDVAHCVRLRRLCLGANRLRSPQLDGLCTRLLPRLALLEHLDLSMNQFDTLLSLVTLLRQRCLPPRPPDKETSRDGS